ncbi:MAG: glycosyl transferase [Clostridia bacterium]|nr:glycosyl transferase [Clostridia bacterium]
MYFKNETSRDAFVSPDARLREVFGDIPDAVDAEYLSAERDRVLGICALPIKAPVCMYLLGNAEFLDWLDTLAGDVLLTYGDVITESGRPVPESVSHAVKKIVAEAKLGAGYINERGEHVIDLKGLPVGTHYTVNLMLGRRIGFEKPMLTTPKGSLDAFGRGAFRAGADTQVLASRFVLTPEEAGEPVNRQFYLLEDNRQIFYSANVHDNVKSAICTHKPNHSVIEYETECGLKITRTIFILPQYKDLPDATEVQRVKIENTTGKDRKIKIVFTGMFGVMPPDALSNDIIYVSIIHESGTLSKDGKVYALAPNMRPRYALPRRRFASIVSDGEPMDEYSASYTEFIGNGTLEYPENLSHLPSRPIRKVAPFFAMAKTLDVPAGGSKEISSFVGYLDDPEDSRGKLDRTFNNLFERFSAPGSVEAALEDVKKFHHDFSSYLSINTGDRDLDSYVNNNMPFQVLYQAFISRSFAWTQKAFRQIGFREIQDMFPALYYFAAMGNAPLAKEMISQWVQNVYEDGYANHNFYWWGNGAGDCSDDQLWLMQAVYRYVCHTGDTAFLGEEYPIAGSDKRRTVLDTMLKAIEYSSNISIGKHGLPLLDHADWNDCLKLDDDSISGPYKMELYRKQLEEKGQEWGVPFENHLCESVMNAFLLKLAEDHVAEMAKMIGRDDVAKDMEELSAKLYDNIQKHAWIENFFARCLVNNPAKGYKYVGSKGDGLAAKEGIDGSYFLNSFSWSILSNCATEAQIEAMLDPIDKYVKTEAGLMLSSPCDLDKVSKTTATDHYFPGDRENGAVFKHATMMSTAAMFKAAKEVKSDALAKRLSNLAYWMLDRVLPYKTLKDPYTTKGNPRFCTQYNNSETLESIGPMLSGTASWLALTVFEFLGIKYGDRTVSFSPILPEDMKDISFTIKRTDCTLDVNVEKGDGFVRSSDSTTYTFDGTPCGREIPLPSDGARHTVTVKL